MVTSSAASDDVISCQCQTVHIYCICSLASSAPRVSRMLGAKCLLHPSLALSNSQLTEQSGCQSSFLQGRTESDSTEVKTVTLTLPDAALSSTLLVPQSVSAQELTANGGARTCWVRCLLRSVRRTSHKANRTPNTPKGGWARSEPQSPVALPSPLTLLSSVAGVPEVVPVWSHSLLVPALYLYLRLREPVLKRMRASVRLGKVVMATGACDRTWCNGASGHNYCSRRE